MTLNNELKERFTQVNISPQVLQTFRAQLQGSAFVPGDDGYDQARVKTVPDAFDFDVSHYALSPSSKEALACLTF
ncbi:hypothetical protein KSD_73850 [Ktedonobacter sp. SOSP1-85]|uniref:hypothetical protein n=1 Tax=Ktedonobacter sp. SOSP1-85 TaxID=2778367 RepID=UPI001915FD7A|nr:hypothetical protein [Ktedonobacter sp. SOSP1-85]GHO79614.1 hypothetical protein KSD_73850 [Ktedonobacter sp. SOSP1-85]